MKSEEKMESWRIALISILITIAVLIILSFIITVIQTGTAAVIKEELLDESCSNLPLTDARDLEVCNE